MAENFYKRLKRFRDEKRGEVAKGGTEPSYLQGFMRPPALSGWPREDILKHGVTRWQRIYSLSLPVAADEIGWEDYINLVKERQGEAVTEAARAMRKQYNITGYDVRDAKRISSCGAAGSNFVGHQFTEYTERRIRGFAYQCPMIQAANDVGMGDRCNELSLWCDAYDSFETRATNPDFWYIHTHCIGRGDKYCRYSTEVFDGPREGESFYQTLKRFRDEKRSEIEKVEPELSHIHGFGILKEHEDWPKLEVLERAVMITARIAVATIMISANYLGWERYINAISGKLSKYLTEAAKATKKEFNITGNTLLDAAVVDGLIWEGSGFDTRQIIEFSDKGIEGYAESCPIIQAAKGLKMENGIEEMSLWCDTFRSLEAHATNPDIKYVHTHCLGRGDKYCRFFIERM